ncbi:hypothetical protein SLS56_011962 [Neofusicoccum ribis]|uniref:Uncharacterized protein n=1 Tax=Neofusicoccum ribis TaxID=45134 RepID=A0ABR3SA50_9PEZI
MGVADSDSFQYGESLRSLAARKRFRYITFLRVPDILSQESGPTTSRDAYLTAVPYLRKQLETFLNPHINIESEIDGNEDTMLTYQSFVALLAKDMPWRDDFDKNLLQDERRYNQEVKKLAECMVKRLIAYERLLYEKFANSIRLSIHLSTGQKKIYIPLLSGKAFSRMNPWNCCILVMANGEIRSGYAKEFSQEYDLVEQDGQPYFFKERSER